jgi:hypothetical protein
LVDQVEHGSSTCGISSSQKAKDISRVGDTLDSQATNSSDTGSQSIEEGWTL